MSSKDIKGLWCDDITFCALDCDLMSCPRNYKNIRDITIPHSYFIERPDDCPKSKNTGGSNMFFEKEDVMNALEQCSKGIGCHKCCYQTVKHNGAGVYDCTSNLARDALELLKKQNPTPVRPVKTCKTASTVGVDGCLIIGACPKCGQKWLNNRDNRFCSGCGVPVDWTGM